MFEKTLEKTQGPQEKTQEPKIRSKNPTRSWEKTQGVATLTVIFIREGNPWRRGRSQ